MQVSVDGYAATGPDDEQRWITWAFDEIKNYVQEIMDRIVTVNSGKNRIITVNYLSVAYIGTGMERNSIMGQ